MIKNLILFFALVLATQAYSQKYSDHYYKRLALFKKEADTKNEVIFLGNSITEGGNWNELFPDINAINRGISGDVSDGILNRMSEITASNPQKIFLLVGTNDLARGKSVAYISSNIKAIIEEIKKGSPDTKIFLQSVLPYNPNVGDRFQGHKSKQQLAIILNKHLKKIARQKGVKFIDIHKKFKNNNGELMAELTYDGLHLNKSGYLFWKQCIKKFVYK